jgi:Fe-S-cluster containining protein
MTSSIITPMPNNKIPGKLSVKAGTLTRKQQLCMKCRKCCGKVGVYTNPSIYEMSKADVVRFYEARGAVVTKSDDELFVVFDIPCPHLTPKGCDIYDRRPKICRTYSGLEEFGEECLWSSLSIKKTGNIRK